MPRPEPVTSNKQLVVKLQQETDSHGRREKILKSPQEVMKCQGQPTKCRSSATKFFRSSIQRTASSTHSQSTLRSAPFSGIIQSRTRPHRHLASHSPAVLCRFAKVPRKSSRPPPQEPQAPSQIYRHRHTAWLVGSRDRVSEEKP